MGLRDTAKLLVLLARLGRSPLGPGEDARLVVDKDLPLGDTLCYDVTAPRSGGERTVVALHGATLNGKDDRRLVGFAANMALSGVEVVVPTLPGLASLELTTDDVEALVELIEALQATRRRPIGLVGFSYGASYGLLAAADPRVASKVSFAVTFGAYHDLEAINRRQWETRHDIPDGTAGLDDFLYCQLVAAHRQRARLDLGDALERSLGSILRRYCHDASPGEKWSFYERHVRDRDVMNVDRQGQDAATLRALSPAGKLAHLVCPVGLIHDEQDSLVPPAHALALFDELERVTPGRHRVLRTSLLSHVTPRAVLEVGQLKELLAILTPLVAGR